MSLSTVSTIMGRISVASKESPIAVMIDSKCKNKFDAFFGATVSAKNYINENKESLIGIFDNTMNESKIRRLLNDKAKGESNV